MVIYVILTEQRTQKIPPIWNHAGARESASWRDRRKRPSQHLTWTVLRISSPVSNPSSLPALILTNSSGDTPPQPRVELQQQELDSITHLST
jgi:hypothetical protein